jgi:thiosulfate/3-mercaptopyruvate sulfurtransferase
MKLFKRARMYGIMCTFLFAVVTALVALAQSRPAASQEHRAEASRWFTEAAFRADERRVSTEQKAEPHPKDPWTEEQLIHPEELLKHMSGAERPLVLHIGVAFLFKGGHIPGSKYVGQASRTEGVEQLKKTVQEIPLNREIVLYCGCCPWKDCPNVGPAFKALREMRFTKVKVLYLPTSFTQDWVEKGLPVEKGESTSGAGA